MRVKLLYFGVLRERFGASDEVVELSNGIAVCELLRVLRGRTSNHAMSNKSEDELDERLWRSIAVAVNREYSLLDAVLRDGDEVALLPPVSGGSFAEGGTAGPAKNSLRWRVRHGSRAAGIEQCELRAGSPC